MGKIKLKKRFLNGYGALELRYEATKRTKFKCFLAFGIALFCSNLRVKKYTCNCLFPEISPCQV